jgi:uncharacterized protein YxjI
MEELRSLDSLIVSQKKEWGEILSGFETKNKYVVSDVYGNKIYYAIEEAGSILLRLFLRAFRPFTIVVLTKSNQRVLRVIRPFRFFFHRANIVDAQGISLGVLQRRFSLLQRKYSVFDNSGKEIYQLFGPILKPWTFIIKDNDVEYGKITKKWGGLLKEGFTDADNFGVIFPKDWDVRLKALFLGAVFLIDFVHFENKGNS